MSDKIELGAPFVEYSGIQILYLEDTNKWRFELRGRERKADSLKQAKEWIDKPEPVKKASKSFERFECYRVIVQWGYGDLEHKVVIVTVTSVGLDMYRGTNLPCTAWILEGASKERSKVNVDILLEITEDTKKKLADSNALIKEAEALRKKAEVIFKSIKRVNLGKYVDNGDE